MGLTRLAIHRPIAILMLVSAFLVVGLIGYSQLPAELNPDIEYPTITVSTTYTGTDPQEMETLITKPIEDSIAGVSGIEEIDSTSEAGLSIVRIQFYFGTDLDTADSEVIQKVDAIRSTLPVAAQSPAVRQADTNGQPILVIAMQSSAYTQAQLQTMATNIVQPALEQATDVGEVDISNVTTREIHVDVDPTKLAAYGATVPDLVNAIGGANVNVASGFIETGPLYYDVRLVGEFTSVQELRDLRMTLGSSSGSGVVGPGNQSTASGIVLNESDLGGSSSSSSSSSTPSKSVYLSDIATVSDTVAQPTSASYFNGKPAVQITVLLTTNGNTLAAVTSCKQELKSIAIDMPKDVHFTIAYDQSVQVTNNLADVVTSLFLGAILAVLVVYCFLHNARGTLIIAIAIPTSMIATFIPLWAFGFSLNQMSLLGLSLAVGILVDDSIVVLENINRHLQLGEEPVVAAINGRTEIGLAALVLTSVDLVVFLPIAFMGGLIGLLYRSFGITVAVATLFSLFVSFTLTPMLASRWYRKGESLEAGDRFAKAFDRGFIRIERFYERVLGWAIRHPWWVVGGANLIIIVIFFYIGPRIGFRYAPDQDQGRVTVTVEAPAGASVAYSQTITNQIQNIILNTPDLKHDTKYITTTIGNSGPGLNITGTQYAHVDLTLWDRASVLDTFMFWEKAHLRNRADTAIAAELKQKVKGIVGAKILPSNVNGFGSGAPLAINLSGPDQDKLVAAGQKVMALLHATPGVYNIDSSFQSSQPEVDVRLDRTLAPEYGLSLETVANALASSVAGDISVQYRDPTDGEQYNIRVGLAQPFRSTPEQVGAVVVGYSNGNPIHLSDIANITVATAPVQLTRLNRQREIQISGYILNGYSVGKISYAVMPKIAAMHLQQVQATFGGETQRLQEEEGYLFSAFILGIVLTYMLMAALFNNLVYPFSIMLSLPQAWAGGLIALYVSGESLSIISMMGVVLLNAIVNKNAILLVDFTNTLRARGYKREDALMMAGPIRLRPIMMTTFTIMVSSLPTALALGRGASFRQSIGIVVEGGIALSLMLTLVVVPSAYVLYDNLTLWIGGVMRSFADRHTFRSEQLGGDSDSGDLPPTDSTPVETPARTVAAAGAYRDGDNHNTHDGPELPGGNGSRSRNGNGNGAAHGNGAAGSNGNGSGLPRTGKYGGLVIRNRRPDDLVERLTKGRDK
jgi:hydrophobic/amphiphilic exporter-1 (mainly G- bacteria), HAE1 family